jgi:hypothetical protein
MDIQSISRESLNDMNFNQLVDLYQTNLNQYKSLSQQVLSQNQSGNNCGITRASYWGSFITPNQPIPPQSDVTSLVQGSFNDFLTENPNATPIHVNNTDLGGDPEPGTYKQLWLTYKTGRGKYGDVSIPEGGQLNWSTLTNDNLWSSSGCNISLTQTQHSLRSLRIIEENLNTINSYMGNYIKRESPTFIQNLNNSIYNDQELVDAHNRLSDLRKQVIQQSFEFQPSLESSGYFVKQSNYQYILFFFLLFVFLYIFTYYYYGFIAKGFFNSGFLSSIQKGGAKGKNYLLLFILFVILGIIIKFLS